MNWLDHTKTRFINPRDVDVEDATYHIPDFSDLSALVKSIREIGIVNSPFVQEREDGAMIPVLGRRRLQAALKAGMDSVKVRMLPTGMPDADGFRLAFWDNVYRRSLDPATVAVITRRVLELFPRKTAADEFLAPMGVQTNGPRLDRLKKIGGLEPALLTALAVGRLLEKTAVVLTHLAPGERLALLEFTERLGMNANKKAEVISHLFDLSLVSARPILTFLQDERAVALLENPDLPVPERAARFRQFVRALKFPELIEREEQFGRWLETLPRLAGISVSPAPAFETCECTIEIRADSQQEAERILARLSDTSR